MMNISLEPNQRESKVLSSRLARRQVRAVAFARPQLSRLQPAQARRPANLVDSFRSQLLLLLPQVEGSCERALNANEISKSLVVGDRDTQIGGSIGARAAEQVHRALAAKSQRESTVNAAFAAWLAS